MRKIFYLFAALSTLTACNGNNDGNNQNALNGDNRSLDQSQQLMQQFKPLINGVWVKKNYIKKTIRRRSPLAAAERATGITTFYIDTVKLKGDSIAVPVYWYNYKKAIVNLKFQPGKNTSTVMLGNDELSYSIKKNDTALVIYHYDAGTRETSIDKYIKVLNKQTSTDPAYGMSYMINKNLVSGTYLATSNTGKRFKLTFTDDGKVSGYPGFNTYAVQNDFKGGIENKTDVIAFKLNGKDKASYAFKINRKTIKLYEIRPNSGSLAIVVADQPEFLLAKIFPR